MDLINHIAVTNFQSIADQKISLGERESGGGLTLIVGPSSTGKSALLRAVKLLAHNSTSVPVRAGEKKTNILVTYSSGKTVGIERGKSLSTYTIDSEKYQKAGTSVPKDVENTLKFYRDTHFAFQFDSPFLLAEPGSAITRIFGEITNAHVLTEAVREGARRKQEASALAKTRRGDATDALQRLETFSGLERRKKVLTALDSALATLKDWDAEAAELSALIVRYNRIKAEQGGLVITEPVDASKEIQQAKIFNAEASELESAVTTIQRKKSELIAALDEAKKHREAAKKYENERHVLLHDLGTCPLCGQETANL
jgi:DNA repair ATPase RecN